MDTTPRVVWRWTAAGKILPFSWPAVPQQSADIVLPTTQGREIRLRRIKEPSAEQKLLLHQLGLSLYKELGPEVSHESKRVRAARMILHLRKLG